MERKKHIFRLQKKWKQQSIQNQIFVSMLLVILLGIGILGNFMYKASINAIEQNYRISYESTLKNSSRVMDMNLRSIIEGGRSFLNNETLQQILSNGKEYGGSKFSTKDQEQLKDVANELASQQPWINYIVFADLYGHYYQLSNINIGTYDFYNYFYGREIGSEEWTEKAVNAKGKEVFFGEDIPGTGNGDGFSYAKYMINPSTREPMGFMIIGISKKLLGRSFVISNEGFESSKFMVIDESQDDKLVYFVGNEEEPTEVMEAFSDQAHNEFYLFSSVKNATTGWSIVNAVEKNEVSAESKKIRVISLGVGGFVLLISFLIARFISKTITKPLKQLETTIALVGEGERHITEEFDNSEVGRIGRKFKEMVNSNLELSEHLMASKLNEREAELLLLQSQINPHFLYNTLDSLYLVAIMHGDDQMADMVEALSDNFKLALNNGGKYITVADSIKWIQGYMKLQNMRYNNRFELLVDISPDIMEKKTITFKHLCVLSDVLCESQKQVERSTLVSFQEMEKCDSFEKVQEYGEGVLSDIAKHLTADQTGSSHRVILELLNYLEEHYHEDIGLGELADKVGMSTAYLSVLFKAEVGTSYVKYLTELRMKKAKKLLQDGHKVHEVSELIGYNNYRYFCNIFNIP